MSRLAIVAMCIVAAACAPKTQNRAAETGSVVIPAASAARTASDDTPAPSSNQGPTAATGQDGEAMDFEGEEEDVGPAPPWGSPSGPPGALGGPVCDQAADCCMKMLSASAPHSPLMQTCDTFRNAPTSACQGLLTALTQSAPQMGVACP